VVGGLRCDAEGLEDVGREVRLVVGDDDLRVAADCGCEHMAIVGVGEFDCANELLVALDEAVGHGFAHQVPSSRQSLGEAWLPTKDGSFHLVEYL
jgi:hypothetical protein